MCRAAPSPDWAGNGISLNAVVPGFVATPMIAEALATERRGAQLQQMGPMPLNAIVEAEDVARVLVSLGSEEDAQMCGRVIFVEDGWDAALPGDDVFPLARCDAIAVEAKTTVVLCAIRRVIEAPPGTVGSLLITRNRNGS